MELLHSEKLTSGKKGASTQKYVDVKTVQDGVIMMRNGTLRAVLMISSVNFELKSTDEQDAIIAQYQNFLNSLDFPLQILIVSRKLNINPYIEYLKEKEVGQENELLRLQVSEYQKFIKNLADVSNIMTKSFYVIIPFSPVESVKGGFFSKVSSMINPQQIVEQKRELFETYKNQLWQRVDHITAGLGALGVSIANLQTNEVIELLYNTYNPSLYTSTTIKDIENVELNKM